MRYVALQKKILSWYAINKRLLPWRETQDPYQILVSEIMLQQTQVDRVIPKYHQFLEAFPTVQALAQAPTSKVLQLWSGLGYNSRALRLQKAAKIIVKQYNGDVPKSRDALLALPGIGPYTANAVLSFAFNLPYPPVDTNIRRILLHELKLSEKTTEKRLYEIAERIIPEKKSREWHNALMDYGSQVLTVKKTGIKPVSQQSTFLHSRRWYRGQIMKLLVNEKTATFDMLETLFEKEKNWVKELTREMAREGLLVVSKEHIHLPE